MAYEDLVSGAAIKYGIDPKLLHQMIKTESGYNPRALSPRGAQGLMQLMPPTAKEMGVRDAFDPGQNIEGGAKYISGLLKQYGGDVTRALAAYNWGPGNVASGAEMPKETKDYVTKVTGKVPTANTEVAPITSFDQIDVGDGPDAGAITSFDQIDVEGMESIGPKSPSLLDSAVKIGKETVDYWRDPVVNTLQRFGNEAIESLQPSKESSTKPLSGQSFIEGLSRMGDVGLGVLETPIVLPVAGAAFGLGVGLSASTTAKAILTGDSTYFWNGLEESKKIMDATMEGIMWHPTTKTGNLVLSGIGKVFQEKNNLVEAGVKGANKLRETPWTPEEEKKIIGGLQYLTDVAALGLGFLKKGEGRRSKTPKSPIDKIKTKGDIVEVIKEGKKAIKEKAPGAPTEMVDSALNALDTALKNKIVKEGGPAKFAGNQSIVEGLRLDALNRSGGKRSQYNRVAKFVEELTVDVSEIDLSTGPGMKDAKSHTRAAVNKYIQEREATKAATIASAKSDAQVSAEMARDLEAISSETGVPPDVPQKLSDALDKPGQVKTLNQMGVTAPTAQVEAIVRDGVGQKLDIANGLDKKGKTTAADKVRGEGLENAHKLIAADGPVTEALVQKTVSEKVATPPPIKTVSTPPSASNTPNIIPVFDSTTLAKGEGYELPSHKRYKSAEEATKTLENGQEVIQIGEKFAIGKWSDAEPEIPTFNSLSELREKFDVGSEVSKERALKDIEESVENGPEFGVAQVGDKYYRTVTKYEREVVSEPVTSFDQVDVDVDHLREMKRDVLDIEEVEPTPEALKAEEVALKEDLKSGIVETKVSGGEVRPEVMEAFQRYRDRSVAKINTANQKSTKGKGKKVKKAEDLSVVSDDFKSFGSREEAEAYRDTVDPSRQVLGPDPKTGKFYLEPKLDGMEDLSFEKDIQNLESGIRRDRRPEDISEDLELSDTGISDLWNIFGNEKGAVEIPFDLQTLRNLKYKLERLNESAEKLGMPIGAFLKDFLNMEGLTLQNTLELLQARGEIDKRIREIDPSVEEIFYPSSPVTRTQKVRTTKKGVVVKEVAQTLEMERVLRDAPREVAWKPSLRRTPEGMREAVKRLPQIREWAGGYMQWTEIPLAGFERYGLDGIWWNWIEKESQRRQWIQSERDTVEALMKGFSKKEIEDMSVWSYAQMKGGPEILEGMGIEIPNIGGDARLMAMIDWFTPRHERIIDSVNYNRIHVGQNPYGKVENYFTWQRLFNEAVKSGLHEGPNTPVSRFTQLGKEFRVQFNPYGQRRVKKSDVPIELNIFTGYLKYIESMSREMYTMPIAALAKKMANAKIPKVEGGKGSVSFRTLNPEASWLLDTWSDNLNGVNILTEFNKRFPAVSQISNYVHRNLVASFLLGSVNTSIKQISAFTGTVNMAGWRYFLQGIGRAAIEKPMARIHGDRTRAKQNSDVLNVRRSEYYFDQFHEFYIKGDIGALKHRAGEIAGLPMNLIDSFVAEASWNAFYDYARDKGHLDEASAKRWAERATVYTQSLGVKGAIAPVQVVPLMDLFVIFQSFGITDFNHIAKNLIGIKNPDVQYNLGHFRKVARYIAAAWLVNQLFHYMGTDPPHPAPIKEAEDWMDKGGGATTAGIKGMVSLAEKLPVVGGPLKYGSSILGPAGELANDAPEMIHQMIELTDWDNLSRDQVSTRLINIGEVLGTIYGIPMTRQIRKSIRAASQSDDPVKILLGIYDYELKMKKGGGSPMTSPLPNIMNGPMSSPLEE